MRLVPYQSVLFIHQPKQFEHLDEENAPPKDQKFWGSVTLILPKPREFTSLVVKLVAYYTIAIPGYRYLHISWMSTTAYTPQLGERYPRRVSLHSEHSVAS